MRASTVFPDTLFGPLLADRTPERDAGRDLDEKCGLTPRTMVRCTAGPAWGNVRAMNALNAPPPSHHSRRAARERSEQERETQPLNARRSPPIRAPRRRIGPLTCGNVERPCFRYHSRYTLNQPVPRRAKACHDAPPTNLGDSRHETPTNTPRPGCGCPKSCRGWSGGISVLVNESATAGRLHDLEVPIWLV